MEIIFHRRNSIKSLNETPIEYGIEVDIRSCKENLIISHDPYEEGNDFQEWLKHYKHKTLIINTKEEGLEKKIISYLNYYRVIICNLI